MFLEISGALKYYSILSTEIQASIRSVVSSGMTPSVTSRLPNTPKAVNATEVVSSPYMYAYTVRDVAASAMGLVIQQLGDVSNLDGISESDV